jgi:hypothetical protein
MSKQSRRLLALLLEAYREQGHIAVSDRQLSYLSGLSEIDVNVICRELKETRHVQNGGGPGYWVPDLDRAERDGLFEPLAPSLLVPVAGPRGRLSGLAERGYAN